MELIHSLHPIKYKHFVIDEYLLIFGLDQIWCWMEDQASSNNFLSVIFGILVIFGIEICGRQNFRRKHFDRKYFRLKIFFEIYIPVFRGKKNPKKSYGKVNEKNVQISKMTKYQENSSLKKNMLIL